mmetsp:Transcript_25028/g.82012  ORF Transcript_25028/g.82012 Transcript_25028/m.82012 type:complete len:540 (-) Transcript_25028:125-1744(-)
MSKDYLKMGTSTAVLKLLASFSASNEAVVFSDTVSKINRKGSVQKRVLMITNRGLYNIEKNKCKRRIDVTEVKKIIMSESSEEFVIHVPTEYDYHYASPRKSEVVSVLSECILGVSGEKANVEVSKATNLSEFVVTKKESRVKFSSFFGGSPGAGGSQSSSSGDKGMREKMAGMSIDEDSEAGTSGGARDGRTATVMHFSQKEAESVELSDFDLLKVIGKGSFGKVMLVRKKDTGEVFAMKVLHKTSVLQGGQVEHTKAERNILQQVQHPFLVGLRYAFQNEAKLYMVLDYLNGGELFFHLKNSGRFDEPRVRIYSAELVLALGHLHSLGIVYRDLKPENVLLDKDGHIRITDFGLAKKNVTDNASAKTFCGTPEYLAPEILHGTGHGRAVDWWSLGTLMFEMLNSLPPFYDTNLNQMYKKILKDPLVFPSFFSANSKDVLTKLLDRNPETRLGSHESDAEEIKAHPFFAAIDFEKLYNKQIPAPFKPDVKGDADFANFDTCFTDEKAQDTYVDPSALAKAGASNFDGFTFAPESKLQK